MAGAALAGRYLCKCPRESVNSTRAGGSLWQFDFAEVTRHNLETRGRKQVNRLLQAGWRLLLVYTLRYEENGVWCERPMAILGKLKEDACEKTEQAYTGESSGKASALPMRPAIGKRILVTLFSVARSASTVRIGNSAMRRRSCRDKVLDKLGDVCRTDRNGHLAAYPSSLLQMEDLG